MPITWKEKWLGALVFSVVFALGYSVVGFAPHYTSLNGYIALDHMIPFIPAFIIFYFLGDVYAFVPIFIMSTKERLRRLLAGFIMLMIIAFVCFALLPLEIQHTQVYGDDPFSQLTKYQHSLDTQYNLFPSLHVAFTVYAWLVLYSARRRVALWTGPLALCILASVLLVKTHLVIDVIGGVVLGSGVYWWYITGPTMQEVQTRN